MYTRSLKWKSILWLLAGMLSVMPIAAAAAQVSSGEVAAGQTGNGLVWHDVTEWGVEGRILPDQAREQWFDRFPVAARETVTPAVWNLSRDSAGMVVRFMTDATAIHVHYGLH